MGFLDWLLARFLDGMIEGEDFPDSMAILAIVWIVLAACILTAFVTRAVVQGRLEGDEPELEGPRIRSVDATEEIPRFVADNMASEHRRPPAPRHRAARSHVAPAQCEQSNDETQVIVPGSYGGDSEETAVLRLNQVPERGGRRG